VKPNASAFSSGLSKSAPTVRAETGPASGDEGCAGQARAAFVAHISHELRTPLKAILGFAAGLSGDDDERLSPGQRQRLAIIERSSRHLLGLVEDLLGLSRFDPGPNVLRHEALNLGAAAAEAVARLAPMAAEQGIALHVEPALEPMMAWADRRAVHQVLLNLLSNAIQYNRRGGTVTLGAEQTGARCRLTVSDTGLGLSAGQMRELFRPFNRLGAENSGRPGSGLGLLISRELAWQMGGAIEVRSEPGLGSVFTLVLPKPLHDEPL
jgi:signal transduction histidine kinase